MKKPNSGETSRKNQSRLFIASPHIMAMGAQGRKGNRTKSAKNATTSKRRLTSE